MTSHGKPGRNIREGNVDWPCWRFPISRSCIRSFQQGAPICPHIAGHLGAGQGKSRDHHRGDRHQTWCGSAPRFRGLFSEKHGITSQTGVRKTPAALAAGPRLQDASSLIAKHLFPHPDGGGPWGQAHRTAVARRPRCGHNIRGVRATRVWLRSFDRLRGGWKVRFAITRSHLNRAWWAHTCKFGTDFPNPAFKPLDGRNPKPRFSRPASPRHHPTAPSAPPGCPRWSGAPCSSPPRIGTGPPPPCRSRTSRDAGTAASSASPR